jgi:SAM-dependent methyltransferase
MKQRAGSVGEAITGFGESDYYRFGLWLGIRNLMRNGFSLGLRKTIGKITQPINSYTRFPEYFWMDQAIRDYTNARSAKETLRILDVGSPKCFGLYLAYTLPVSIEMTDISALNVDEYKMTWNAVESRAIGTATFALQDARSLRYEADSFDVVYSMSVIEHIDGPDAERQAIREMLRVLKPGGLLLLSMPLGNRYVEQKRAGLAEAVRKTQDGKFYFFQRIYDKRALKDRIIEHLDAAGVRAEWTIWRRPHVSLKILSRMDENVRGLFGFINPWVSRMVNRCSYGIGEMVPSSYGDVHSTADIYGDVVLTVQKAAARHGNGAVSEQGRMEDQVGGWAREGER